MDALKFYDKKAAFDAELQAMMFKLYRSHWKFLKELSCKERSVLDDYKGSYAALYNSILYFPNNPEILKRQIVRFLDPYTPISLLYQAVEKLLDKAIVQISIFDHLFLQAPLLEKQAIVYRGISGSIADELYKAPIGQEIITKSFNSTAFNFNVALQFSQQTRYVRQEGVILRITLPKGTPHIILAGQPRQEFGETSFERMIDGLRASFDQTELVIGRGMRLVIEGREKPHLLSPQDDYIDGKYQDKNFIRIIKMRLVLGAISPPELPDVSTLISEIDTLPLEIRNRKQ